MSWKNNLRKEETAKDFVINHAKTGKSMADALRMFAQQFPQQVPPNVEESIKRAEELDVLFVNLEESKKKLEETQRRV